MPTVWLVAGVRVRVDDGRQHADHLQQPDAERRTQGGDEHARAVQRRTGGRGAHAAPSIESM